MNETHQHPQPPAICFGAMNRSLSLPILVVMLGLLLLEPVSPQFSLMHLRPLLPVLGGAGCISALRNVLHLLLCPDPD